MSNNETTLTVIVSTRKRPVIDRVKDAINDALLNLENRGDCIFWDIQEIDQ